MIFVFAALAAGIASGVGAYAVGIAGTAIFCLAALYLHFAALGTRGHFDGLLRVTIPSDGTERHQVDGILREHCSKFVLVSLQQVAQADEAEHAYQVCFRREGSRFRLVNALQKVTGVRNLSLLTQETHVDL
jgi:uncharacterized membrane protein YhiD involved in acid resistance